jgi:hypothetical protein
VRTRWRSSIPALVQRGLWAATRSPAAELLAYHDSLDSAAIARQLDNLQTLFLAISQDKTEQFYLGIKRPECGIIRLSELAASS